MILVTGGLGFIGSNFVRMALGGEFVGLETTKIVVLDLQTYAGKLSNLGEFLNASNLEIVTGDICDQTRVDDLVNRCDSIVHFAAESHVDRSITGPDIFITTNVLGTNTLLKAANKWSKRIVVVSTDEVYGSLITEEATEDFPLVPSSPYSASKASADLLGMSYFRTFKTDVVITRSANNYGMNQDREKFIPLIITKLLSGENVPIYGNGQNIRNWIHAEDHCQGIYKALMHGAPGEIFNFGTDDYLKNIDLCKLLIEHSGRSLSQIEFITDRKGHDFRYGINSVKSRNVLDWKPRHKLANSLDDLFEWYTI